MKAVFTILIFCLSLTFSWGQSNSINYKALIKDDAGNVVANNLITAQFSILQGTRQIIVYTENHSSTTDENGILILNIGEGTVVSGDFSTIDWGSADHFLNVKINTGNGLVDMGTSEFNAVPYAKYALNSQDSVWDKDGSDISYTAGDVGIGTTTPEEKLHVAGDLFVQSNLGEINLGFPNNGNRWEFSTRNQGETLQIGSSAEGNISSIKHFRIKQGGEINIGNLPDGGSGWMHIKRNSSTNKPHLLLEEEGTDYARIAFRNTVSSGNWDIAGLPNDIASSARLNFFFRNSNGSSNRMIITGDGKVGIDGTPTSRFHIHQGSQAVGNGLRFSDQTANLDWNITHGYSLRFHYGNTLKGFINVESGAYVQSSDKKLKSNISDVSQMLSKVKSLKPKVYTYKGTSNSKKSIGLLAQDAIEIFTELVEYSEIDDVYGIDYAAFSVVAIKAIQEQQAIIDDQQKQIDELKKLVLKSIKD